MTRLDGRAMRGLAVPLEVGLCVPEKVLKCIADGAPLLCVAYHPLILTPPPVYRSNDFALHFRLVRAEDLGEAPEFDILLHKLTDDLAVESIDAQASARARMLDAYIRSGSYACCGRCRTLLSDALAAFHSSCSAGGARAWWSWIPCRASAQ